MEIIALSAYARAGKDTAADVLVEEFGFRKVAFADKLREVLLALDPIVSYVGWHDNKGNRILPTEDTYVLLSNVINTYGWDGYKSSEYGPEIRRLLQRLGTEAGRKTLWDTIWIDAAFAGATDDEKIVISDARFFNEFDAVRARGGIVWRIERPGIGPVSDHASETEAPGYKYFSRVVLNSGDLDYYKQTIREEYSMYREALEADVFKKGWSKDKPPARKPLHVLLDADGLSAGANPDYAAGGVVTSGGMPKSTGQM